MPSITDVAASLKSISSSVKDISSRGASRVIFPTIGAHRNWVDARSDGGGGGGGVSNGVGRPSYGASGGPASGGATLGGANDSMTMRAIGLMMGLGPGNSKWLNRMDQAAGTMYQDFRPTRGEALELERMRLVARGGTGDYGRFRDNLAHAMNRYNVQDRSAMIQDVGTAYGAYYSQGMGGGLAGERSAAYTVGQMHTLASAAGVDPRAVSNSLGNMYSAQSYYSAMAAGIMTRDSKTGDMLETKDIVNQYYERLKGYSTDEIKRALAPGGMFRAELEQTWGDANTVEMLTEGILATVQTGGRVGDNMSEVMKQAGYFGLEWTQGKDSQANFNNERNRLVDRYTTEVTNGMHAVADTMAYASKVIASMQGPIAGVIGATFEWGGAMDEMAVKIPNTWSVIEQSMTEYLGNIGMIAAGSLAMTVHSLPQYIKDLFNIGDGEGHANEQGQDITSEANREWREQEGVPLDRSDRWTSPNASTNPIGAAQGPITQSDAGSSGTTVNITVNVQNASDAEAMRFVRIVQESLTQEDELTALGSGTLAPI